MLKYLVASFYHFVKIDDCATLRAAWTTACERREIKGSLLIAPEGINATLSGRAVPMREFIDLLCRDPRFSSLAHKESWVDEEPFLRLKIRLKKEIVTLGIPATDPTTKVGKYVKPENWNALIDEPDVVVIDARNHYETRIGAFRGAIDPQTSSFGEFPQWIKEHSGLDPKTRIAMYCTGGIRCEKASSYMLDAGFEEVYHLEGGILKYLEDVPVEQSAWEGECYVFDRRVALNHDLEPGSYSMCRACGYPLRDNDQNDPKFIDGVACAHCFDETSDEQKASFAERQKQWSLANKTGRSHFERQATSKGKPEPQ